MKVPLLDLRAQYLSIKEEVDETIARVHERGNYVMGQEVEAFEAEWARFCGAKYGVGVSSGTDALYLTLKALDEQHTSSRRKRPVYVLTTPFTFFATAQAINNAYMRPVFVDVEPNGNIDVSKPDLTYLDILLPVHLYGRPVSVPEAPAIPIVEDAAQAHGLPLRGLAACHSFYPSKNLGAWGQAGAVVTNDPDLADRVRELRTYGERRERFVHHALTGNHRLDEIQAAVLRVKLRHLSQWNRARRRVAQLYRLHLSGLPGIIVPEDHPEHCWHIFGIRVTDPRGRESLSAFLKGKGIQTAVRYPVPLHLQPALSFLGYKGGDFPVAERWARENLSLPIFPEMTPEMAEYVAAAVEAWVKKGPGK